MPDISIQFHALPEELFQFVEDILGEFPISLSAIYLRPFNVVRLSKEKWRSAVKSDNGFPRLIFTLNEPVLSANDELDFARKNHEHLRLDVGNLTSNGLQQSWLCSRTDDAHSMKTWRRVAARLKKITQQGVTAVSPQTGATCEMKSFRYSPGAKSLADRGEPMILTAGTALLRFGK